MGFLSITSTNPDLSFIIKKNPASGMQLRQIRKGSAFGWFTNKEPINGTMTYNMYFKDADDAVSFGDQEFEYLNTSRYNSSIITISLLSEFLNDTIKKIQDKDSEGFDNEININAVHIQHPKYITRFIMYFKDEFDITLHHIKAKTYSINIKTKTTLFKTLNLVNLLSMFNALLDRNEYVMLDKTAIDKYIAAINRIDAPFFIRYLFNRQFFKSKNMFKKYKNLIESSERYNINFAYGDTASQRRAVIRNKLVFDKEILDIGCGEGFYAIPFAMNSDHAYHAIDIDESLINIVNEKAIKKEINNIKTYNNFSKFLETYNNQEMDIILTEVIEHMPQQKSIELISQILAKINFDKFIITVPNKEFNKFYMLGDDEFRHDDHDWEPTKNEFVELISKLTGKFNVKFYDIGDNVNGITTSLGCTITKKV